MSHENVHAQGNVPFSWEDKPGVSKVTHYVHHDFSIDVGSYALTGGDSSKILVPPPPLLLKQSSLKRSASVKGLRWCAQEKDPFLAAYKECTKGVGKGNGVSNSKLSSKKNISFWLKESCDVRGDDKLMRFSNLPPLPKDGIRRQRGFVYPLRLLLK